MESTAVEVVKGWVRDLEAIDEWLAGSIEKIIIGLFNEVLEQLFACFAEGFTEYASGHSHGGGSEWPSNGQCSKGR
ncbi:MAG: hypothetical protein WDN23_11440 [Edaphobacter sp.]